MAVRIPFFGLISMRSPLLGFLEHYEQIAKGMDLIEESMECYISGGERSACKDFTALKQEVDEAEEKADAIKRYIRNHLPRSIFLPVEKHLFFSYTHQQDDILDWGQTCLQWLAMRDVNVPEIFQRDLIFFLGEVSKSVKMLRPAIEGTIDWVNDEGIDREELKTRYRDVRSQHNLVTEKMHALNSKLFRSDLEFKDIYQLIHFVEHLHKMSHSAEGCVNLLRVMIAR
jgi:predicted phosphate transport protein (TIGR00153 family)